jgi:transposase-like protein
MKRIPPVGRITQLAEQMAAEARQGTQAEDLTSTLIQLGARKLIEELLEAETADILGGRGRYERRQPSQQGSRNGYKARRVDCAEGRLEIDVPQIRGLHGVCQPSLWAALQRRTEVLERLVVEMYVRGLSTRDIEDALQELGGQERSLLSHASVSRLSERLWEEYEAFSERDLSGFDVVYLFADAVYESLRRQAGVQQAILVTWAILRDGSKVLLHMSLGNQESERDWLEHFRSLVRRGLPTPLTVTTDGAPGLMKAVEAMWPEAERIRCWVHKMQNILDKVPDEVRSELKAHLLAIRDAADHTQGQRLAQEVIAKYERSYPSAMQCLREDLQASLAHLKLPPVHRQSIRTTNLVERSFEEERRRAKVLPRFRTEKECLKLVFAVLWRASERWRRVRFSEVEQKQLERYIEARERQRQAERRLAESTRKDVATA